MATAKREINVRSTAERDALDDLDQWCLQASPDASTPLEADDLVQLARDCINALGLDPGITSELTVNTVHYYRRKEIIDAPLGRTVSARYDRHHLWQVIGARLAGHLGLVTLAEARDAFAGADEPELRAFVAARVADARARTAIRTPSAVARETPRPLPRVQHSEFVITLPGGAMCIIPKGHSSRHSLAAARDLVRALAKALNVSDP